MEQGHNVGLLDWASNAFHHFIQNSGKASHAKRAASKIIRDIEAHAQYRTLLYATQETAIHQFLLEFKRETGNYVSHDSRKDTYNSIQLAIQVLNIVAQVYIDASAGADEGASAQKMFAMIKDEDEWKKQNRDFYFVQAELEKETFLKIYVTKHGELSELEKQGALQSFDSIHTEQSRHTGRDHSIEVTKLLQHNFLQYYYNSLSSKNAQALAFEGGCRKMFGYYAKAFKDAQHQALFEAVRSESSLVLEQFLSQYREELNNGQINVNTYFTRLVKGIEPLQSMTDGSETILHWAVAWGGPKKEAILRALLKEGANVNLEGNSVSRSTPLHTAVLHGALRDDCSEIPCLMEAGADPLARDFRGRTVLSVLVDKIEEKFDSRYNMEQWKKAKTSHEGFFNNLYLAMEALISKEAVNQTDIVIKDSRQYTSLGKINGATPFFKFMFYSFNLFEIDVKRVEPSQSTAPSEISNQAPNFEEFLNLFIDNNADFSVKDNNGDTLMHHLTKLEQRFYCLLSETSAIAWAVLLGRHSAPLNEKNNAGYTPHDYARKNSLPTLAKTIESLINARNLQIKQGHSSSHSFTR